MNTAAESRPSLWWGITRQTAPISIHSAPACSARPTGQMEKTSRKRSITCTGRRILYNRLETTEFSVAKQWAGDSSNAYGTRPETGRTGFEWEVSFVIQRSADGGASWENVTVYESGGRAGRPHRYAVRHKRAELCQRPCGGPAENGQWRPGISVPRARTADGLAARGCRKTGWTQGIFWTKTLFTTVRIRLPMRDGSTAVNTLRPTRIYAEKQWNKSSRPVPVEFALEYLAADGGGYVELAQSDGRRQGGCGPRPALL